MDENENPAPPAAAPTTPAPPRRRWPRRLAVALLVLAAALAATVWYGGREQTLQTIVRRIALATDGRLHVSGATGSLYGAMHIDRIEYRTPTRVVVATDIDIDWSPLQYFSGGIAINALHAQDVRVQVLGPSPPAPMPASLASPFPLHLDDARVARLTWRGATGSEQVVDDIRFKLLGGRQRWELRDGSASTPWGMLRADGRIDARRPFALSARASLVQASPPRGRPPASLSVSAGGSLALTQLTASGKAGAARGNARMAIAPYETVPLRTLSLDAAGIDPGLFNPSLPRASMAAKVDAAIDSGRRVRGSLSLVNEAQPGPIDMKRLPLRRVAAQLGGSLDALQLAGLVLDFGPGGSFTGGGTIGRHAGDKGLGTAMFTMSTRGIDLKALHSKMKRTKIAGTIAVASRALDQQLTASLRDANMRLEASALLSKGVMRVERAELSAGRSRIAANGEVALSGKQDFRLAAQASHLSPSSFGDYPQADINATIDARGTYAPQLAAQLGFALRPSRLFGQPLSGRGRLALSPQRISGVDAVLGLGANTARVRGAFGAKGDRLTWRIDGGELAALRDGLRGVASASGAVTGTFAAPRTSFDIDARQLGWGKPAAAGPAAPNAVRASGEAWYDKGAAAIVARASGTASGIDPTAFGVPFKGSLNGSFDAQLRTGAAWRASGGLQIRDSQLEGSPVWGHARLATDRRRVSGADIDLHVGANVIGAQGGFGLPGERLDLRVDAPQLGALGQGYAGVLRANGAIEGTLQAPALALGITGSQLRFFSHTVREVRVSAGLGAGLGSENPLITDIDLAGYEGPAARIATARVQTLGTVGAHTVQLAARGDDIEGKASLRGGWDGRAWNGSIEALENRGTYSFALQAPATLTVGVAPGERATALLRPHTIALGGATLKLSDGLLNIASLNKDGPRWRSTGTASAIPLSYLAQFSPALRDNTGGDLLLGAEWALDMQAGAGAAQAPLRGMLHVFREKGDLVAGAYVPVAMGLTQLDARAEVDGGALRVGLLMNGSRSGSARVDATVQLVGGRLADSSALRLSASADMGSIAWLAPLTRQPGLELDGALRLALAGGGTLASPSLDGDISGDRLSLLWGDQGVRLRNGVLRAKLAGDSLRLERLSFEGPQGRATADGTLRFAGGEASMQLRLDAQALEVLSRPDRTLVVTGQATLSRSAGSFDVAGRFRADRARIELAPQERPTLSDDVVVLGRDKVGKRRRARDGVPLNVDLEADLGDAFYLKGMGLDAQLAGLLHLRMVEGRTPRVTGSVRAVSGTYAAYGQRLAIERAVLNFTGAYDNPALNIRAVRRRPEGEPLSATNVEAGVEVRGTALAPSARLVSTPNVSESDKLAWLVLGHGIDATQGQEFGVLSAAAGALLGGRGGGLQSRIASSLGVDELGLSQAKGLESTVLTVGKRISQRAYLSFEQGASSASSLVKLRYKLNPRVTLQFQTGANTALDILYSWTFD